MEDRKIRVAITHGDTNGIGYELIFKTFVEPEMLELCTPIIYGSPKTAAYHRKALDVPAGFSIIGNAEEAVDGRVNLLTTYEEEVKVELGTPTDESGNAALLALDRAMTDFRSSLYDVLVTAPVDNSHIRGFNGQTGFIEKSISEGKKPMTLLLNEGIRIGLATDNLPLTPLLLSWLKSVQRPFTAPFGAIFACLIRELPCWHSIPIRPVMAKKKSKLFNPLCKSWPTTVSMSSVRSVPSIFSAVEIMLLSTVFWLCITTKDLFLSIH